MDKTFSNLNSSKLTEREYTILKMLGSGMTAKEIADAIGRGYGTVKNQICALHEKLGVANSCHAISICKDRGWI